MPTVPLPPATPLSGSPHSGAKGICQVCTRTSSSTAQTFTTDDGRRIITLCTPCAGILGERRDELVEAAAAIINRPPVSSLSRPRLLDVLR